jgi:transposase
MATQSGNLEYLLSNPKLQKIMLYGIDVSKDHLDIYSVDPDGVEYRKRIANKFNAISKFLVSLAPDSILCAEFTGVYSDLLAWLAYHSGIKIALIHGYTLKHSMGNTRGKSDIMDAEKIYEYSNRFNDKLRFYEPEPAVMDEVNELFNLRNQLVKQKKMIKNGLKAIDNKVSYSLKCYQVRKEMTDILTGQIKLLEDQMLELISSDMDLNRNLDLVTSIKGVGNITAIELIITTGNFKKIATARQAAAYAGVCPYLDESGKIKKRARTSGRSDKSLKRLLYLCAVCTARFNKDYVRYKERKMNDGKHFFLVMNNIANKLLRTIYAVVQTGTPYDNNYIAVDPRLKIT